LLIVILLVTGCEKDPEPLTVNSAIHTAVGAWPGDYVEDMRITARGPYGDKSILVTSYDGYHYIEGLGNGTYIVSYSAAGYGTIEVQNIKLFGGDTVHIGEVSLYKTPPKFSTPELRRAYIGNPGYQKLLYIETRYKSEDRPNLQMIFFVGTSSDVDWNRFVRSFGSYAGEYAGENTWTVYISYDLFLGVFHSGDHLYIKGYACNERDPGYFDYYKGLQIFPTMDKSRPTNVVDIVLP
jgi:hypothetical protein